MKTPEELAEEWVEATWDESGYFEHEKPRPSDLATYKAISTLGFLAGYRAAQEKPDTYNSSNNSNSWISVKDRLPEVRVPVVVWLSEYALVVQRDEYLPGRFNWIIDRETRLVGEAVTYWMPLPEPPKEEQ